jgi:hypothetical protein
MVLSLLVVFFRARLHRSPEPPPANTSHGTVVLDESP